MKLHNNLIEESEISLIKNTFLCGGIGWFYNPLVDYTDSKNDYLDNHQFIHRFYDNDTITSDYIKLLYPIIDKLSPRSLIRIKANLTTRTENIIQHQYHTDYDYDGAKTSIFYVNTNNGYTLFKNGTKVESVENRLVTFDCKEEHTGTTCTNEKIRVVINFNYF
jgi:hypothetical protein